MTRKKTSKPSWNMTTKELDDAAAEFDEEFVADRSKPLSPEMRARWERAKLKQPAENGVKKSIAVVIEEELLQRCSALARKKRLSRDDLIARGLRVLLAAEGE